MVSSTHWRSCLCLKLILLGMLLPIHEGCSTGPGDEYVETGDLPDLRRRARLRILMPPLEASMLPRQGYAIDLERRLAEQLADELGLAPEIVTVAERDVLLDALLEGRGDLALARLTITPERQERFAFSVPLEYTREVVAVRADDAAVDAETDLIGRRVAVRTSASHYQTMQALAERVPGIGIMIVPDDLDTEQILARVADGSYDAAVADEDLLTAVLTYRDDLRQALVLTEPRPIAWALRPGAPQLKAAVNHFLQEQALTRDLNEVMFGDLETIRERKVLRVLTRNNAVTTYLYRGEQLGFEFELARRFARSLDCRIRIIIPPDHDDLIHWLLEGRGDLIAASMTPTEERVRQVAFTASYLTVRQTVVVRDEETEVQRLEDLAGRRVSVRPSSAYHTTLAALRREHGIPLEIDLASESMETEELIAGVADGTYETTVADSHILGVQLSWRDDVRGAFPIGPPAEIAWAVRSQDAELLTAADEFLRRHRSGSAFFNILKRKYFTDKNQVSRRVRERPTVSGRISPYDPLFRRYGGEVNIDWRLLAAQAFQESRFDSNAESWAGAMGLMQLLPRTALELGIMDDLRDPATGIRSGALYLRHLADSYNPKLPLAERLRFALGAYNAGPGHILDARRLAREQGLDPDVWFDNVERALPLLSRQAYARQARYGYCRCQEPVRYVRDIQERYRRYVAVVE